MTHLRADAVDVRDVDWTRPTAIVLGNEKAGEHSNECGGTWRLCSITAVLNDGHRQRTRPAGLFPSWMIDRNLP